MANKRTIKALEEMVKRSPAFAPAWKEQSRQQSGIRDVPRGGNIRARFGALQALGSMRTGLRKSPVNA